MATDLVQAEPQIEAIDLLQNVCTLLACPDETFSCFFQAPGEEFLAYSSDGSEEKDSISSCFSCSSISSSGIRANLHCGYCTEAYPRAQNRRKKFEYQ